MTVEWLSCGRWHEASDSGYRVSMSMCGDVARYSAWAPEISYDALRRLMRTEYRKGGRVPMQRELLGVFGSTAEARAECERHSASDGTPAVSRVLPG